MATDIKTLSKNSFVYIIVEVMMKGIGFLLIPVYTRLLSPSDYGILAIVTSIASLLTVFYTLSLSSASSRFYFEDPQNENYLKELWGTNITFVLIVSICLSTFLILKGDKIFSLFIGDLPFYPYVLLGLVAISTMPLFEMYQEVLRTKQIGKQYGLQNLSRFVVNLLLSLFFVVILKLKAEGPLLANAITGIILFTYTAITFGRYIKWGINFKILKNNLSYSLPLLPHSLTGFVMSMLDRLFINKFRSTADAGIYNIGFSFGIILNLVTAGINEAFAPYFIKIMKKGDKKDLNEINSLSLSIIGIYVVIAIIISLFAKEVIMLMTTKPFHDSWKVTPFIVFSNVFQGVYRFFVAPLFFNLTGTKFVSLGTFISAVVNIGLLFYFIPRYGMIGAGIASLLVNLLVVIIIATIAYYVEPFDWNYKKITLITGLGLIGTFFILYSEAMGILFYHFYTKIFAGMFLSTVILLFSNNGINGLKRKFLIMKKLYFKEELV